MLHTASTQGKTLDFQGLDSSGMSPPRRGSPKLPKCPQGVPTGRASKSLGLQESFFSDDIL